MCLTELLCACPCYSVSYSNIKGSGEAFGEALKANTSLKTLKMTYCDLDTNDSKGLASGLAVHSVLTSVSACHLHSYSPEPLTLTLTLVCPAMCVAVGLELEQD